MSEIVNESLRKAAKGTAIAFVGMLVYMLLEFITRVIIARNTTQSDYGIFSIGFVLMNFLLSHLVWGCKVELPDILHISGVKGKVIK